MRLFRLLLVAVALSGPLRATDYYVDPVNGSDAQPGTLAAPWRTIAHATRNAHSYASGDRILLLDGIYIAASGERFPISMPPGVEIRAVNLRAARVEAGVAACFTFDRPASYPSTSGLHGIVAAGLPCVRILGSQSSIDVEPEIRECELLGSFVVDPGASAARVYPTVESCTLRGPLLLQGGVDPQGFGAVAGVFRSNVLEFGVQGNDALYRPSSTVLRALRFEDNTITGTLRLQFRTGRTHRFELISNRITSSSGGIEISSTCARNCVFETSSHVISGNEIRAAAGAGMVVSAAGGGHTFDLSVSLNRIYGGGQMAAGIDLSPSGGIHDVSRNTVEDFFGTAIELGTVQRGTASGNTIRRCTGVAVRAAMYSSTGQVLEVSGQRIEQHIGPGIQLSGTGHVVVQGNSVLLRAGIGSVGIDLGSFAWDSATIDDNLVDLQGPGPGIRGSVWTTFLVRRNTVRHATGTPAGIELLSDFLVGEITDNRVLEHASSGPAMKIGVSTPPNAIHPLPTMIEGNECVGLPGSQVGLQVGIANRPLRVLRNRASGFGGDGIRVDTTQVGGLELLQNLAVGCLGAGIFVNLHHSAQAPFVLAWNTTSGNARGGIDVRRSVAWGARTYCVSNLCAGNALFDLRGVGTLPVFDEVRGNLIADGGANALHPTNFALDPHFAAPLTGDFGLAIDSPARDRGLFPSISGFVPPTIDLLGRPRVRGLRIDLGALESDGAAALDWRGALALGGAIDLKISGPPGTPCALFFAPTALASPLLWPFGRFDLDPALVEAIGVGTAGSGSEWLQPLAIPSDPLLEGATVFAQGVVGNAAAPTICTLTNALALRL
ncbi:MAG: right-handed parallel beta-helix repeat-containing protein [Planctomycetes bacterium]|nr:right-handed parallel beta-helix repeat-containing protein [Planctomycetota bacterium]